MDESRSKCYPCRKRSGCHVHHEGAGHAWTAAEDTEGPADIPATFLGETVEPEDQMIQDTENGE